MRIAAAYHPLDAASVPAYVASRPDLRARLGDGEIAAREVGDGNLNLVFVVRTDADRPGIVLKQSLPWVRVHGEGWPLTLERARREAQAYEVYQAFAGDSIPAYLGFDPDMYVIAMEDLGELRVWRAALNDGEIHAGAAAAMGALVARIAFWTSDLGMEPEPRKRLMAASINPEMCRITEDLVLTEPFIEHERNRFEAGLQPLVDELRADTALCAEVSTLKDAFLTHGEALIHGDLHTGGVMVGGGRAVAIDAEFAFYGPIGFDLGALWANVAIAAARAQALGRPAAFGAHLAGLIDESWDGFEVTFRSLWPVRVDRSFVDASRDRRVAAVWRDAVGFAGTEAIRRMIGYAHVRDVETLDGPARSRAAAAVVRIGRRLVTERAALATPSAVWDVVAREVGPR